MSQALDYPVSVYYSLGSSLALYPADWTGAYSGNLEFAIGETSKETQINIIGDTRLEIFEYIRLGLYGVTNEGNELVLASSSYAEIEIINDDPAELTFHVGQQNKVALMLSNDWINEIISVTPESKPSWLRTGVEMEELPAIPGFYFYVNGLSANPDESLIDETGEFTVQLHSISGELLTEMPITYTLVEGDRDLDGVPNPEDIFPDNPRGATDDDADGIGDEWENEYFGNTTTATESSNSDTDGLLDIEEFDLGTNPNNEDTDNDEVNDDVDLYPLDQNNW